MLILFDRQSVCCRAAQTAFRGPHKKILRPTTGLEINLKLNFFEIFAENRLNSRLRPFFWSSPKITSDFGEDLFFGLHLKLHQISLKNDFSDEKYLKSGPTQNVLPTKSVIPPVPQKVWAPLA